MARITGLLLLLLLAPFIPMVRAQWRLVQLTGVSTADVVEVADINTSGVIAGTLPTSNGLLYQAARWFPQPNGTYAVDPFPFVSGEYSTWGSGIAENGAVAGYSRRNFTPKRPAAVLSGGLTTVLDVFWCGDPLSEYSHRAFDINESAVVVGTAGSWAAMWVGGALHWLAPAHPECGLPDPSPSIAYEINDSGLIVGTIGAHAAAFVDPNTMAVEHLSVAEASVAYAVSNVGVAAGYKVVKQFGQDVAVATTWRRVGATWVEQELGVGSVALGINDWGYVAGVVTGSAFGSGCVYFEPECGRSEVRNLVTAPPGWHVGETEAISNMGDFVGILYGVGGNEGRRSGYFVTRYCAGDANCDGAISFTDIDYFVAALSGHDSWKAYVTSGNGGTFPSGACGCWPNNDADRDGAVDFKDIDLIVERIGESCP